MFCFQGCVYFYILCYECLFACMSVPDALTSKKRALDLLELELHTVVNCHVSARN